MASQKEKYSILRFLNSKNENVASIVTPVRGGTQKRDDNVVRPEDKVIVKPSNTKTLRFNGNESGLKEEVEGTLEGTAGTLGTHAADCDDDGSIGTPFLFLHDDPQVKSFKTGDEFLFLHDRTSGDLPEIEIRNGDLPEIEISNIEGNVEWKTEDTEAEKRGEDAAATELDPKIRRFTRSTLFPDNPPDPKEHKIKRSKGTTNPKIKLEPITNLVNCSRTKDHKTKKSFRSNGTADPKIKLEPTLVNDKIEKPTISKGAADPKINQVDESRKKSDTHKCPICEKCFDHQAKLSGHLNMVHSKVKVDRDKLIVCPYPDCNYT